MEIILVGRATQLVLHKRSGFFYVWQVVEDTAFGPFTEFSLADEKFQGLAQK